jgi:polar amino acid transport system permease protein
VDLGQFVISLLGHFASGGVLVGGIWQDTIGGIWDDTAAFRTQYYDLQLMEDEFAPVLQGFWYTIELSLIGGALSLIWGLVLAVLRQLPGKVFAPIRWLVIAYIDVFRGVPLLLVLLLISGGLGALAVEGVIPRDLGVPRWFDLPDPFWYGIMGITLTYGAYMAEVYRAGIEAVPSGQMEAARSLGMSHGKAMRYVIVPQAVRKVIPPLLNDFIALMKDTSLVSVLGLVEVVQAGRDVQSEFFNSSALTLGAILFLIVTIPLARLVDWLIAREQSRTQRGGGDGDGTVVPNQPLPVGGAGA